MKATWTKVNDYLLQMVNTEQDLDPINPDIPWSWVTWSDATWTEINWSWSVLSNNPNLDGWVGNIVEQHRARRIIALTVRAWCWRKWFKLWALLGRRKKMHVDLMIGVDEMNARPGGRDYLAARERWYSQWQ